MVWVYRLILVVALGGAVAAWVLMNRGSSGPSHCMGCGKCDKTGICVLTNKPLQKGWKKEEGKEPTPPEAP